MDIFDSIYEINKKEEENLSSLYKKTVLSSKCGRIILLSLLEKDGRTQNDLCQIAKMKGATLCECVKNMEKENLIVKKELHADKRSALLFLSPDGYRLATQLKQGVAEQKEKALSCLSLKEKNVLAELLEKLNRQL